MIGPTGRLQVPPNITYDQAASIPLGLTTAYVAMYNIIPHGIGMVNPVNPSGRGHYKDESFVVIGGASSVGQFGSSLAPFSQTPPLLLMRLLHQRSS
jgi:NADPH:quinone reductase-like Zn-dependent oxidoreductase